MDETDTIDILAENDTPEIVKSAFDLVTEFISSYGWTILFVFVIANLIWSHFRPKIRRWRDRIEEQKQASAYHKDPSLLIEKQESLARARQRIQEEHDGLAQKQAEKAREQEEQKRQEKITKWEKMQHGKSSLGNSTTQSNAGSSSGNSLREGYNPLINPGGGVCYRPSRRGGGGGGG